MSQDDFVIFPLVCVDCVKEGLKDEDLPSFAVLIRHPGDDFLARIALADSEHLLAAVYEGIARHVREGHVRDGAVFAYENGVTLVDYDEAQGICCPRCAAVNRLERPHD